MRAHAAWSVFGEPPPTPEVPACRAIASFFLTVTFDAVKIRPRETADQAAARAFLARHNSLRGARLGELVHPLDLRR